VLTRALEYGYVLRSAEIAGAGERLLDLAVAYGLMRRQFGELIGRFQAVQYLCSDIAIDAHLSWLYSLHAAGLEQEGLNLSLAASMAKAVASRSAPRMALRCHEVFAGVGFMNEVDVQLFTRRLRNWELELGDAAYHRNRLGVAVARGELHWDHQTR
jgi:alkylation response protein AidB-like acyl-CoA dehydrogenase